ncbi:MAG TPA: T9SS type A sorting domain-containing protein [Bacteroidia bacterium]|nr:T9SS type A sorting domain-containing protein [Bacteroidia bacterium]
MNAQTSWQRVYGNMDEDGGKSVMQTSDGGIMVAGTTISYGAGFFDFYLLKLNSFGDTIFSRIYGSAEYETLNGAIQTNDGGYLLVGDKSQNGPPFGPNDLLVIKTTSTGTLSWSKIIDFAYIEVRPSVIQAFDGGIVIAGSALDTTFNWRGFIVKLSSTGSVVWFKSYDFAANTIFFESIKETGGGFVLAGTINDSLGTDMLLLRVGSTGIMAWAKRIGTIESCQGENVLVTASGDILLAGYENPANINQDQSMLIARLNSGGTLSWFRKYQLAGIDTYPTWLDEDGNGNIILSGFIENITAGPYGFLVQTSSTGTVNWANAYGGYNNTLNGVTTFTNSSYVAAGIMASTHSANDPLSVYVVRCNNSGISGCYELAFSFTSTLLSGSPVNCTATTSGNPTLINFPVQVNAGAVVLDGCTVGVSEPEDQFQLEVYPNPFSQTTTFQFSDILPLPDEIIILDALGREVKRQKVFSAQTEVNRNGLADGLYFYHILRAGALSTTGKLLIR